MSRNRKRGVYKHVRADRLLDDLELFRPVRKVVRRTTKRVVGRFPSRKSKAMISWESQVERDFLYLLETDPEVEAFVEQPERLRLEIDGDLHSYVPDFLIGSHQGQLWFAEVKHDDEAERPENKAWFAAAAHACLQLNVGYRLVLESDIRREPRLSNAKLLLRYTNIDPEHDIVVRATALVEEAPMPLGALREALGGHQRHQDVMALLLSGQIAVNLDQPLTDDSPVWLPKLGGCE